MNASRPRPSSPPGGLVAFGVARPASADTAYVFLTDYGAPPAAWEAAARAQYGSNLTFRYITPNSTNATIGNATVQFDGFNAQSVARYRVNGNLQLNATDRILFYGSYLLSLMVTQDATISQGAVISV